MIKHSTGSPSGIFLLIAIIAVIALAPPAVQWIIISVVLAVSWFYNVNTTISFTEKDGDRHGEEKKD